MSLTDTVRSNRALLAPLSDAFCSNIVWSDAPPSMRAAPPASYRTGFDWALAGVAFDFWFRGFLYRHFDAPEVRVDMNTYAAALLATIDDIGYYRDNAARIVFDPQGNQHDEKLRDAILSVTQSYERASVPDFLNSKVSTLQTCVDLARLDGILKNGKPRPQQHSATIADVMRIARLTLDRSDLFLGRVHRDGLDFPAFSPILRGCSADFAIDDTLMEIKTTYYPIAGDAPSQLAAYAYLHECESSVASFGTPYRYVGIYAARHGAIGRVPISVLKPHFHLLEEALHLGRFRPTTHIDTLTSVTTLEQRT